MPRPTSPRDEVSFSVRLPKNLVKEVDLQAKNRNMYRNEIIKDYIDTGVAMDLWFVFKVFEDWIFLFDRLEMEIIGVNINVDAQVLTCEKHIGRETCKHIEFAKKIPYVQSKLKKQKSE